MSGICGILRLDCQIAEGVDEMIALLERRGPDGSHLWRDGPVALGHTLLATTPEALCETLPFTDPATGCTITADVRLDNRSELITDLGLASQSHVIGDGELILRSYLAWGEACVTRFLGDFAFAIWNPRAQQLFAARDQIGMRQLIYTHIAGRTFAFATEARAVVAAPDVTRRLNERRVADFLEDFEAIDYTSTFFKQVFRLPPAHCLVVDNSGLSLRRYWSLTPEPELTLGSDEAYVDAFLKIFSEAIRCRLRSAGPVGSMLSGGMDSGSVVSLASRLLAQDNRGPLLTFSAIGPDFQSCEETRAIYAALALPGLKPHLVSWAASASWREDAQNALEQIDEPFDGHMNLPRLMYLQARRAGIKVMLDGVGGDIVLSAGNPIAWLLRQGHYMRAWRESKAGRFFWQVPTPWSLLRTGLSDAVLPTWLRRRRWLEQVAMRDRSAWVKELPDLAKQSHLAERRLAFVRAEFVRYRSVFSERTSEITSPVMVVARERYDRVAAASGIEPRDPFLDLRVIDFAKRLPLRQLQEGGWPKILLRRATRNLLPDNVRWRRGKQGLGGAFNSQLIDSLDRSTSSSQVGTLPAHNFDKHIDYAGDAHDLVYLRIWLRNILRIDSDAEATYASWADRNPTK